MLKAAMAVLLVCTITSAASAERISSQVKSNALIEVIAERGLECNLLKRWQNLSLRALALEDRRRWDDEKRAQLATTRIAQGRYMSCDSEILNVWIEGARQGFDYEMLPPYLVVYETMASLDSPPHVFAAVSLRADRAPVLDAVRAELTALAASGRLAEGGKAWPEYIESTRAHALSFASQLEAEGGDQAAAWIAQSAMIVETWYDEETKP